MRIYIFGILIGTLGLVAASQVRAEARYDFKSDTGARASVTLNNLAGSSVID